MTAAHLDRYDHDERDMSLPQPEPLELPMHFPQPNGGMPSFRLYDPERPEDLPEALLVAYGIIGKQSHLLRGSVRVTREEVEEYARGKLPRFLFGEELGAINVTPVFEDIGS